MYIRTCACVARNPLGITLSVVFTFQRYSVMRWIMFLRELSRYALMVSNVF